MSLAAGDFWNDFQAAEIPRIVLRHKKKVACFFCLAVVATAVITLVMPRVYRSQGKLLVRTGRESTASDPVATLGPEAVANAAQLREYDVNSVAELLTNRELVEKVIDAVGIDAFVRVSPESASTAAAVPDAASAEPSWWNQILRLFRQPPRENAIQQVGKRLKVAPIAKSNVVVLSYDDSAPDLAQLVVSKLMASYLDVHMRLNRTRGSFDFLEQQSNELRNKLHRVEGDLAAAKTASGIISTAEDAQKIGEQIKQTESSLLAARAEAAAGHARIERLHKTAAELAATEVTAQTSGMEDKAVATMREELYGLLLREQELLASAKPDYFEVPQIRQRIAQAKTLLNEQPPTRTETIQGPGKRYEEAQLQLLRWEPEQVGLDAKVQTLERQLAELKRAVTTFHENELRISQLQREVELCEKDYRRCQASFEQARLDQALEASRIASINVAQPATLELKPVWPKPLWNAAVGLFVGVFGGMCLAFGAEYRGRTRGAQVAANRANTVNIGDGHP